MYDWISCKQRNNKIKNPLGEGNTIAVQGNKNTQWATISIYCKIQSYFPLMLFHQTLSFNLYVLWKTSYIHIGFIFQIPKQNKTNKQNPDVAFSMENTRISFSKWCHTKVDTKVHFLEYLWTYMQDSKYWRTNFSSIKKKLNILYLMISLNGILYNFKCYHTSIGEFVFLLRWSS